MALLFNISLRFLFCVSECNSYMKYALKTALVLLFKYLQIGLSKDLEMLSDFDLHCVNTNTHSPLLLQSISDLCPV